MVGLNSVINYKFRISPTFNSSYYFKNNIPGWGYFLLLIYSSILFWNSGTLAFGSGE